jgi:hypothetical protein
MNIILAFAAACLPLLLQANDNPEFGYWSAHKIGSWVKLRMEMEAQGVKVVVESTNTLIELGTDKVIVEQKMSLSGAGQDQPESTKTEEILKNKDKDPIKIEKEGDEVIEAGGKKLSCHWIEGTQKETRKVKFWLSKDVPGGVAKAEASGGDIPGVMKISAVSWEKK